jgi:DNA (cytosine-5)-methyltransferase 1
MTRHIDAADLFCGAGGTSSGLALACRRLSIEPRLLAVNHWAVAVATHAANHPWATHLCADLAQVDPNRAVEGGRLDILAASPECTHHSVARGGRPCSDQSRASAWHVLHWAERLRIDSILIENVPEFRTWGPLTKRGRPMRRRKGDTYHAWLQALASLGYQVDERILNAADYGAATVRRRLFVQARRGSAPQWPDATHVGHWRPAREIIDWGLRGQSLSERRQPLSPKTMARIAHGLRKFGGEAFLAVLNGTGLDQLPSSARSVSDPLPSLQTCGHVALCQPFILPNEGFFRGNVARSLDDPLPTITAGRGGGALVEPFIVPVTHDGGEGRAYSVEARLATITGANRGEMGLCEPFLVSFHGGRDADRRVHPVSDPLPTQDTSNRYGLAEPFITKYYGHGKGATSIEAPVDAIRTRDCHALVEPVVAHGRMEVRFRMLAPHELARAMGFEQYQFSGNKGDQVRQIGNAVAVPVAEALCYEMLRRVA